MTYSEIMPEWVCGKGEGELIKEVDLAVQWLGQILAALAVCRTVTGFT